MLYRDCGLKMTAEMIERLQGSKLDRTGLAAAGHDRLPACSLRLRQRLSREGQAALAVYHDKPEPLRLADELRSILEASPYLGQYLPELNTYLISFPNGRLPDSENFLYWSQEKFGFKPVVSVTHVTIYKVARGSATSYVIASKQIYADHYFTGSLGSAAFVDRDRQRPGADAYLIYLNRTRVDLLQGLFSGLKRFFIRRRVLDGTDKYLRLVKQRLEDEYRSRKGGAAATPD
jgi:hypothetical protein